MHEPCDIDCVLISALPHNKVAKENIFKGLRFYLTPKPTSKLSYWQKIGDFCLETEDFVPHSTGGSTSFECLHLLLLPLGRRWILCSQRVWVTSKFRKLLSFKKHFQKTSRPFFLPWGVVLPLLFRTVNKYTCILEGDTITNFQDYFLKKKISLKDSLEKKLSQDTQKCEKPMKNFLPMMTKILMANVM